MKISTVQAFLRNAVRGGAVIALLLIGFSHPAYAQRVLKGTVVDENNLPLPGVNVSVKGTTRGTVTDLEGNFSLSVQDESEVLVISFVGYSPVEIPVLNQSQLKVTLKEEVRKLDEVVVIGYGVQKKADLTGAVATVASEDLVKVPASSIDKALQGRAAGVFAQSVTGAPGSNVNIMIRGITSINGTNPMWVVDGVPADPKTINPNDIESMSVLKDASSAAIYGANGGNGVVIVSTKKGKSGRTTATLNVYTGWQEAAKYINVANGPEFATMYKEYEALLRRRRFTFPNPDTVATYNYQDLIFRTAPMQSYDLGISGGTDKSTYYFGVGYLTQEGILRNSSYDKLTVRMNLDQKLTGWFRVGENMSFGRQIYHGYQEWQLLNEYHTPILAALNYHPFVPPYDTTGNWSFTPLGNTGNPVASVELLHHKSQNNSGKLSVFAVLEPIKGLSYENKITGTASFGITDDFYPIYFITPSNRNPNSKVYKQSDWYYDWLWQHRVMYNVTLAGVHNISAMAGFEAGYAKGEYMNATRWDLINESREMRYFNASQNDTLLSQLPNGAGNESSGYSYYGRLGYDYKGIFLAQANFRRDASSKFGPRKRFGNFPSFSLGFKFSELSIVKEKVPFMSFGKLRYGWGKVGNNAIPDYVYFSTIGVLDVYSYSFDNTTTEALGAAPNKLANLSVAWEGEVTQNLGLDLGFFGNKLYLTAELFKRYNEGMLMEVQAPGYAGWIVRSSYQEGGVANPIANVGNISNKGIEISADWKDKLGKLSYSVNFNFTYVNTKAGEIRPDTIFRGSAKGINGYLTRTINGQPIGEYYGFITQGLFKPEDADTINNVIVITNQPYTIDNSGNKIYAQPKAKPGDFRFKDVNGDGRITDADMVPMGNPNPKYLFGMNINLEYGWFDLSVFLQGVAGNKIFNATKFYMFNMDGAFNWSADYVKNHYRENIYDRAGNLLFPENHAGKYPRLDPRNENNNFSTISDFYMEDGAYLRLKNIQLGITIPQVWTSRIGIERFRFYVSASNLLTFTRYSGYDPEVGSSDLLVRGLDKAAYPQARIYTVGLNVNF